MPGLFDEKPDEGFISQTAQHLTSVWSDAVTGMEKADSYEQGTFKVFEDERDTRHAYHPPKAAAKIQHAVDTQIGLMPKIHKQDRGDGAAGEARANRVELGLTAVLKDSLWSTPNPVIKTLYRNLVRYGVGNSYSDWHEPYAVKKLVRRTWETKEEYEKRQKAKEDGPLANPICVYSVNPRRMLATPGESTPACAIIQSQMYSYQIAELLDGKREYIKAKDVADYEVDANPFQVKDVLEYKTAGYLAMCLKGGEMLYCEENPFGLQLVHIGYSGWGGEVSDMTQGANPKYWCVGLLAPVYESLRTLAMKRSAARTAFVRLGQLRLGTDKSPEEVAAAADNPLAILSGKKEDYWWLEHPQIAEWVFDSRTEEREIDEATYVSSVSGTPSGVDTVGQEIILKTAAERRFGVLNDQVQRLVTSLASDILEMVDIRGEPIKIGTTRLSPKDIDGSYEVDARFVVVDPLIELRTQEVDMRKVEVGVMSKASFWENHNTENGTEEQRRLDAQLLRDFIKALPPEQNPILEKVMEQAGMGKMLEEIKARMAQAAQPQAAPGGGGPAPMPMQGA